MTKLIFNADDFGYCEAINYGILESHLQGVLTSTTLMVTMPGFQHAVACMKANPTLKVGLHLNIVLGRPLTKGKSLTDDKGNFIKPVNFKNVHDYDVEELYQEIEAQYQRFVEYAGKKPTHIDSHLFTTDNIPSMEKAAIRLAEKYHLPLRNHDILDFKHVDFIQFRTYNGEKGIQYVLDNFVDIATKDYAEIMTHPGYLDNHIMKSSSYNLLRLEEYDILTSKTIKDLIAEYHVELISYEDVPFQSRGQK